LKVAPITITTITTITTTITAKTIIAITIAITSPYRLFPYSRPRPCPYSRL
jgi:hypothetical protein